MNESAKVVLVLFRFVARQRECQAANGDEDQAEHQRDGEQAAFVVDDIAGDIGARDADRHHGGGHDGGQRESDDGHQLGERDRAALVAERAAVRGCEAGAIDVVAHGKPSKHSLGQWFHHAAGSWRPFDPIAAKPVGNRGVFVIMVNET